MNEVALRETGKPAGKSDANAANTRRPPVDIYEDNQGVTLYADLPGVAREDLQLEIEGDTLTIDAPVRVEVPGELQQLYAEARTGHYRRSFVLGEPLDRDRIEASLHAGVLKLRIPKQAEVQPRKIDVRSA